MSKPTGISLKDFCKAVELSSIAAGYGKLVVREKSGSAVSFSFFEKHTDAQPCAIFAVHTLHNKKREIVTSDLKKVWERTGIKEEVFRSYLEKV